MTETYAFSTPLKPEGENEKEWRVLCVIGKSGTGKSTLVNELVKKYGFEKVITTTNRPKRDGEVDGVDYHFIRTEEFHPDDFLEYKSYNVADGETWYYGVNRDSFDPLKRQVIILTPGGYKELKDKIPLLPVWLTLDNCETMMRLAKRGDNTTEIERRMTVDRLDFTDFYVKNHFDASLPVGELAEKVMALW